MEIRAEEIKSGDVLTDQTRFGDIEVGVRFHYNVDADGHEPYLYKVTPTEGYVEHGSHSGMRETISADEIVHTWDKPAILHQAPTEVERAALTCLLGARGDCPQSPKHVGLHTHILALAQNPDERRNLDEFIWETSVNVGTDEVPEMMPLRDLCAERGQVCWQAKWDHDRSAYCAILDCKPTGQRPATDDERLAVAITRAAAILARAIRKYRIAGRPNGDQTHTIQGMGSPLLSITTSLAAAVGEFHYSITNAYATRHYCQAARNTKQ